MSVTYAEMKKIHHKEVIKLVKEAWFDEERTVPEKTKWIYAKGYLFMYLRKSDYTMVAYDDNKFLGFIFGKAKGPKLSRKIYYNIRYFLLGIRLLFHKAGYRGIKITLITDKVNRKLVKPLKKEYQHELCLFIVSSESRGQGIGSKFEEDYTKYLKENNMNNVYLYTDTYSNYHFYEKRGFIKLNEMKVNFGDSEEDPENLPYYFVYGKKF